MPYVSALACPINFTNTLFAATNNDIPHRSARVGAEYAAPLLLCERATNPFPMIARSRQRLSCRQSTVCDPRRALIECDGLSHCISSIDTMYSFVLTCPIQLCATFTSGTYEWIDRVFSYRPWSVRSAVSALAYALAAPALALRHHRRPCRRTRYFRARRTRHRRGSYAWCGHLGCHGAIALRSAPPNIRSDRRLRRSGTSRRVAPGERHLRRVPRRRRRALSRWTRDARRRTRAIACLACVRRRRVGLSRRCARNAHGSRVFGARADAGVGTDDGGARRICRRVFSRPLQTHVAGRRGTWTKRWTASRSTTHFCVCYCAPRPHARTKSAACRTAISGAQVRALRTFAMRPSTSGAMPPSKHARCTKYKSGSASSKGTRRRRASRKLIPLYYDPFMQRMYS